MPSIDLRFFAPEDNAKPKPIRESKAPKLVKAPGHISTDGKLVLPQKSVIQLGFDPLSIRFKIGAEQGKRKIKVLYMIPSQEQSGTFTFAQAAKSYTLSLGILLKKNGLDYATKKYGFSIVPFSFEEDVTGYELRFDEPADKPVYTGKKRGPKPKAVVA
ncbi:hypothetical protein FAES_3978 [Fibrella aestuarina BUZ 2]|uniref:Uncharacterized protein n=1 Tax=Fibrella aestuarina BUZ 2 TaxID=1166018 RepID=I0KCX6_9BACT|nr:hypothetical protein [Fibrella aestuarina]CCH01979.1 hypothetical protein FAES_3978 [Fibrella aestuarina BUZ 2]